MPPKTPNEIIEELKSRIDFEKQPVFFTGEAYQKPLEWLYDVLTTLLAEKDKEKEEAVAEARGECQISNFNCSTHGFITPRPICPKCFPDATDTLSRMG